MLFLHACARLRAIRPFSRSFVGTQDVLTACPGGYSLTRLTCTIHCLGPQRTVLFVSPKPRCREEDTPLRAKDPLRRPWSNRCAGYSSNFASALSRCPVCSPPKSEAAFGRRGSVGNVGVTARLRGARRPRGPCGRDGCCCGTWCLLSLSMAPEQGMPFAIFA